MIELKDMQGHSMDIKLSYPCRDCGPNRWLMNMK